MPEYKPDTTVEWADERLPDCDLCKIAPIEAHRASHRRYDARLKDGHWAYVCQGHFEDYGIDLGLGLGQELLTPKRIEADRALDEASKMFLADPHNLFKQNVWLEAHHQLMDLMYPTQPDSNVSSLAEHHPMRNHPAFRAIQARLERENRPTYADQMRDSAGDPE